MTITHRSRRCRATVLVGALVGLSLTACGANKGPSLAGEIDVAPPAGYVLNSSASGNLDKEHAAVALPYTVTSDAESQLGKQGFRRGSVRVWTKGSAFATAAAIRVKSEAAASAVVDFETASLKGQGETAYVSPFPPISQAQVFVVSGVSKASQRGLFCQGVYFSRADIVYVTTTCDTVAPAATSMVAALAQQLLAKALA